MDALEEEIEAEQDDLGDFLESEDAGEESYALVRRPSIQLADHKGELLLPDVVPLEPIDDDDHDEAPERSKAGTYVGDDLYTSFVKQATRIPRLSEEEERALGLRVRETKDEKATKQLVLHNMRLAIKMAHQYRRSWTNLMDLVQEASAGMAIAAQKWDPDKGTRFGTYAAYWIRAQLTKFLMTNGRLIHTGNTRAGRKVYFNLPLIQRQLLAAGIEPTAERVAAELHEDPKEVALVMSRLNGREASLSASTNEDGSNGLESRIASGTLNPEQLSSERDINRLVHDLIVGFEKSLENERDKAIWREHLVAQEPLSLVDLGKRYGVSKQRMGQLATRIKRAFRRHIIDRLGPDTQLSCLFSDDAA